MMMMMMVNIASSMVISNISRIHFKDVNLQFLFMPSSSSCCLLRQAKNEQEKIQLINVDDHF